MDIAVLQEKEVAGLASATSPLPSPSLPPPPPPSWDQQRFHILQPVEILTVCQIDNNFHFFTFTWASESVSKRWKRESLSLSLLFFLPLFLFPLALFPASHWSIIIESFFCSCLLALFFLLSFFFRSHLSSSFRLNSLLYALFFPSVGLLLVST